MRTLAVVSARGGSKEVPRKNVLELGGSPLVAQMFRKALMCKSIDKVICSTDDAEIASVAKICGVEVPFIRPTELAGDRVSLIDVTKHAMLSMDNLGFKADIIVQLAPTCPFVRIESISMCVEMASQDDCECAVSLAKIEHGHPYRARRIMNNGYFENFIQDINVEDKRYHSRQDMPELYYTNGAIYARKRHLLECFDGTDLAMGRLRKGVIMNEIESVNIDRMIDLQFSRFLVAEGLSRDYFYAQQP